MTEIPFPIAGGWTTQAVKIAERTFQLLLPADPDQVLEQHLEGEASDASRGAADPYWAALWSSATPTAEFVLARSWRPGTQAIELGCGVGLVGLAAAARGLKVVLTDHVADALQIALANAARNGLPVQGQLLDWNCPVPADHQHVYDAVLASDVLYCHDNHVPLLRTIDQLLTPDGKCWIGDPGRYHSRAFLRAASERFRVRLESRDGSAFSVPGAGSYQRFVLSRLP